MERSHGDGHLHHRKGPVALQEHTFHVHSPFLYLKTLVALLILMVLTVWAASWNVGDVSLGFAVIHGTLIKNVVALAIACIKASLVLAFFMGVAYATKLTKLWAAAGFVGFALLFLALGDYSTRKYEPTPRWTNNPGSSMQRSVHESRTNEQFRSLRQNVRF